MAFLLLQVLRTTFKRLGSPTSCLAKFSHCIFCWQCSHSTVEKRHCALWVSSVLCKTDCPHIVQRTGRSCAFEIIPSNEHRGTCLIPRRRVRVPPRSHQSWPRGSGGTHLGELDTTPLRAALVAPPTQVENSGDRGLLLFRNRAHEELAPMRRTS